MEDHGKAIDELERGRDLANQLRQVISGDDKSATTQDLVKNMIRSFTNTLFLFGKYPSYESHEVSQRDTSLVKSDGSLQSYKGSTRRECSKRRKTIQTWEKISEIQTHDGHQWRKYGQKVILNTKYLRNYYRCTHKLDQRCHATKQVQQIQEEPPLYRTTYFGHHTCKSLLNHEILHDPSSPPHTSTLISFDKTFPMPNYLVLSSYFSSPSINKECKESPLDNYLRHITLSSTLKSDHMDAMSNVLYHSVEFDYALQSLLNFDEQLGML